MSHSEERSPKRQRRSYSPASPSAGPDAKTVPPHHQSHSLPQTPPPSVHMSPSWQSQSLAANIHSGGGTFPTTPSTVGFASQVPADESMEGSDQGQEGNLPTPADHNRDEDRDATMSESQHTTETINTQNTDHRRTDHDRQPMNVNTTGGAHRLYRLNTQPIEKSQPHPSQNVISLYSLDRIQASVARKDAQGNKINKLRKSYENKVKALGLEGRSKAEVGSLALQGLLDPGWDMQVGDGTTAWQARSAEFSLNSGNIDKLLSNLDGALSFAPGQLPKVEHESWKGLLGLDEPAPVVARPTAATNSTLNKPGLAPPHLASKVSPSAALRGSAPNSPRNIPRPDRANKKRRYDESSYSGYPDAYDDDEYSTGGNDDRRLGTAKRQKRKDFPGASSSPGTYNSSMVGVHST